MLLPAGVDTPGNDERVVNEPDAVHHQRDDVELCQRPLLPRLQLRLRSRYEAATHAALTRRPVGLAASLLTLPAREAAGPWPYRRMATNKDQLRRLRAEVERIGGRGTGRRYSPSLKARICGYARRQREAGESIGRIAAQIGISEPTLTAWLRTAPSMLPVVVRPSAATAPTLRVLGPGGLVIEGLDLDQLAALIAKVAACSA